MYPDHKIYRKTAIRFSFVQRVRALISEEESKKTSKLPTYKQGSELMGAKIAQPDYADPQKLFPSLNSSQLNLDSNSINEEKKEIIKDTKTSESRPKNVFEAINLQSMKSYCIDTGQKYLKIKSPMAEKKSFCDNKSNINSSQNKTSPVQNNSLTIKTTEKKLESQITNGIEKNSDAPVNIIPACSDSYYEKILETSLNNEDKSKPELRNKLFVNKEYENFQNNLNKTGNHTKLSCAITDRSKINEQIVNQVNNEVKKVVCIESKQPIALKPSIPSHKPIKRPVKPPPPIPAKPARISQTDCSDTVPSTKGWVKTVVGRFE